MPVLHDPHYWKTLACSQANTYKSHRYYMCCDWHLFPSWDLSCGIFLREGFNDLVSPNLFFLTTIIFPKYSCNIYMYVRNNYIQWKLKIKNAKQIPKPSFYPMPLHLLLCHLTCLYIFLHWVAKDVLGVKSNHRTSPLKSFYNRSTFPSWRGQDGRAPHVPHRRGSHSRLGAATFYTPPPNHPSIYLFF